MRLLCLFLLTCTMAFSQGRTYASDMASARVEYVDQETSDALKEHRGVVFRAIGKDRSTLAVVSTGGIWERHEVDSYLNNEGRLKEMKKLGFRKMSFIYEIEQGKKFVNKEYATFSFKSR